MRVIKSLLLLAAFSVSSGALANNITAAQTLTKKLKMIDSYKANFTQIIKDAEGMTYSKSLGKVSVLRPGRFIWDTISPAPVLVVADGTFVWTYDVDLEQVVKQDAQKALTGSPAALLAGKLVDLSKSFHVRKFEQKKCKPGIQECYHLTPKNNDPLFSKVWIGFRNNKLTSMELDDALGQHIEMRFSNIKVNTKLSRELFEFKPPKNIDIIYNSH